MSHPVILAASAVPASMQSNIHDAAWGILAAAAITLISRARRFFGGVSGWSEAPAIHCGSHGGGRILACLGVIAAVLFAAREYGTQQPAAASAKPKTVTITHTITKVVNAHPWITGTEFTWLCIGVGVLVVGAIAIRRSA